jgi:hypothetical protein
MTTKNARKRSSSKTSSEKPKLTRGKSPDLFDEHDVGPAIVNPPTVREAIARANGSEAKKAALAAFPPDQVSMRVRAMTPAAADLAVRLAKAQDAAERAQNASDLLEAELLCAIGDDRGIEGTHAGKHYRAIWGAKTSGGGLDTKALRARGESDPALAEHLAACEKTPGATRSLTFTVS